MDCIMAQIKNQENRVYDWLVYHINEGFDTFVIYDDNSTDKTLEEIKEVSSKYSCNIIIKDTMDCPSNEGNVPRQIRNMNKGIKIVKELNPEASITFIDSDEFIVTNESLPSSKVIRNMMREYNSSQILYYSFDIKCGYEYKRGYIKNDETSYRWCYDKLDADPRWRLRTKGTILVKDLNKINFIHVPNESPEISTYSNRDYDKLRIHHFRTPNLKADLGWCYDNTIQIKSLNF